MLAGSAVVLVGLAITPATAQDDPFADTRDGGKLHSPSGFVCPARIGLFERDAVGAADPETGADFCAYSALNGVYGTIRLTPLQGPYDAKASLAPDFIEEEQVGGKRLVEGAMNLGGKAAPSAIYTRTYETAVLEDLHYRVLFAGAQYKNWSVEATIEYADPRDTFMEDRFLHAVYAAAESEIAAK